MGAFKLQNIIDNKHKFFNNDIDEIYITEKIIDEEVKTKVITINGYNSKKEKVSISIPFIEGMNSEYLSDIFLLFSKNNHITTDLDNFLGQENFKQDLEIKDYYKITLITKYIEKEFIVNTYNILNSKIPVRSLTPIYQEMKEIIMKNNIQEVTSELINEKFSISNIAKVQIIYLLSLLSVQYQKNEDIANFMTKKNLHLRQKQMNYIDLYYLNNKLLAKRLLTHDELMNMYSEILINFEYNLISFKEDITYDNKKLMAFKLNKDFIENSQLFVHGIYFEVDNKICFVNKEFSIINLLEKIIY